MTKSAAFEKLDKLQWVLGYPDEVLNKTAVDDVLMDLNISETAFYENYKNIVKWKQLE